ncbi:MAG: tRNA epoxyqueuosine(34) reductase QueG [Deltaproteobacteria bacterium]|nr:tRNA epoxyqueuosine(34) reductase QueG [Deltaproteobacteria bacterium]
MRDAIRARAIELGFDAVAVARADAPLDEAYARYEAFIDAGMHGPMGYLADHRDVRRSVSTPAILDGARSVICVARRYANRTASGQGVVDHIARYARGRDYHGFLRGSLRKLADFVASMKPGAQARALCDTAPVLERAWAARAGLGFIGKNGMLILPGMGSYVLLGEVVTTLAIEPDRPQPQRCGACDSCLKACPTGALVRAHILDARKCISTLTIEQRGAWDPAFESQVGPRIFGCDACLEVCPFNASPRAQIPEGSAFDPLAQWRQASLAYLLAATPDVLSGMLVGSPLRRPGIDGVLRNLIVAAGNSGDPGLREGLGRLRGRLADGWLREAADRAIGRL